jgi:hypothetical protein
MVVLERVGLVPNTRLPDPVSSVTAEVRLAEVRPPASSDATPDA